MNDPIPSLDIRRDNLGIINQQSGIGQETDLYSISLCSDEGRSIIQI